MKVRIEFSIEKDEKDWIFDIYEKHVFSKKELLKYLENLRIQMDVKYLDQYFEVDKKGREYDIFKRYSKKGNARKVQNKKSVV